MASLIFILTVLTILIILIIAAIKLIRRKPIRLLLRIILILIFSYSVTWTVFYFTRKDNVVPLGTSICFDDWCATVTGFEFSEKPENKNPKNQFVILHIKMINQARGIAQKPSEPRVKIIDDSGNYYSPSAEGQAWLEKQKGKQIPIDEKLELHQSLETQLVFEIPTDQKNLKAIIEEGPFITQLIFYSDREVFLLK